MAGILSPLQPRGGRPQKTVQVSVKLERHAVPPMLKYLSIGALWAVGMGSGIVMFEFEPGSMADIAGTIAFSAWLAASVAAMMEHIMRQKPDSRREVIEEITRAEKTHLTIL